MKINTVKEYIEKLPDERRPYFEKLRNVIRENIPPGFNEEMSYGMVGYVVPHSIYEKGYHVNPKLPLPFVNLGNQKNYIALYHNGIYMDKELRDWFEEEYKKRCKYKLDMGKSCIRFKKMDDIPYELIAELVKKISVNDFIETYEKALSK